jgi:L,D-transpeptidase YcbB
MFFCQDRSRCILNIIEYFTAYVDQAGALQLRSDIYGYSRRVRAALGLEG